VGLALQIVKIVLELFGVQFVLRGLAAWGVVNHLMFRGIMLW